MTFLSKPHGYNRFARALFLVFSCSVLLFVSLAPIGARAQATGVIGTLEIMRNGTNYRAKPGGKVLCRLYVGDTVSLIKEKRVGENLWYYAYSDQYGYGCVRADNAIIAKGERRLYHEGWTHSILTDELKRFLTASAEFFLTGRFERWTYDDQYEYVMLMYENLIIAKDPQYEALLSPDTTANNKQAILTNILWTHYGAAKLNFFPSYQPDFQDKQGVMNDDDLKWYDRMEIDMIQKYHPEYLQEI